MLRGLASRWGTAIAITIVVAIFAWVTWQRRWVADDGLIFTRTVRQFLAGNGPVFNIYQRVEANTSTLWTYLLIVVTAITRADVVTVAVTLGGLLSIGGLAVALDATRRLHRERGTYSLLVPAGALVILGVF